MEGLNFHVDRGEVVGFLGPNGAGKSTTMRILCGALGATSGRATVDGHDVAERPGQVKRLIGYLPEVPPLYSEMVVRDFLSFAARLKGVASVGPSVEDVLARVGLSDVAGRLIGNLSKGYRQRVGIAQALVHRPAVLVLDEPTSGLDPAQRVEIRDLLRDLSAGDTTVILSTHVLAEVEAICSRAIVIHKGRIVSDDAMAARQAWQVRAIVARPDDALVARWLSLAGVWGVDDLGGGRFRIRAEGDVREVVAAAAAPSGLLELSREGSLEDVFLALTAEAA